MAARPAPLVVGGTLSVEAALAAARGPRPVRLAPGAARAVDHSARRIARAVAAGERVYGVTTGFGSNATTPVSPGDAARLQRNLLLSHALGDGPPLPDEAVRLALALRIHALAQGKSGIRRTTLAALIALYERDLLAVVPARGSVGASGDLAPLALLALPLLGEGRVRWRGEELDARTALKRAGLEPVELSFKEGLALINGMQVSLAIALLALERAEVLLRTADVAAALTTEALCGRSAAFDPRLSAARGHPGQVASAARLRTLLAGSRLVDLPAERVPGKRVAPQDSYGIRCAPQVHGASADGIRYAREAFAREIDAVTDNPLVLDDEIVSGGNFHGQPVALPADHLKLCVSELGSIAERRVATLVDPHMNEGLPPYLAPRAGLECGFMIPQYVAAALASESRTLCAPASADSIPTGANVEDHVSMAPIAARRALEVAELVTGILAIELMTAAQAVELRAEPPSPRVQRVLAVVREALPFRTRDEAWGTALPALRARVADGRIARAAGV